MTEGLAKRSAWQLIECVSERHGLPLELQQRTSFFQASSSEEVGPALEVAESLKAAESEEVLFMTAWKPSRDRTIYQWIHTNRILGIASFGWYVHRENSQKLEQVHVMVCPFLSFETRTTRRTILSVDH